MLKSCLWGFVRERERERENLCSICVLGMDHSTADENQRAAVEIGKDENGISQVLLRSPRGSSARVSLHGGQVRSWKTERGEELLFTSTKANLKPPAAVRGGIPICFPQFGKRGSLEKHGFARNRIWVVEDDPPPLQCMDSSSKSFIDLLLKSSDDELKIWPHSYEVRLRVILNIDGSLTLVSRIRNVNSKPFSFSFAYHTYFSVSDISEVRVEGLETLDYLDNLCNRERFTEQGDALTFESEIDRVYLSSSDAVAVFDHEKKRTFVIRKEGLPDVVVWNPWEKKARAIPDFGDDEYKQMLCVVQLQSRSQSLSSQGRNGQGESSSLSLRRYSNLDADLEGVQNKCILYNRSN